MSGTSSGSGPPRPQVMRMKKTPTQTAGPWKFFRKLKSKPASGHPGGEFDQPSLKRPDQRPQAVASTSIGGLPLADLPDEELPQGAFCFPEASSKVLRQRHRELERRAGVRALEGFEGLVGELQELDVGRGHRGEQVLASCQERKAAERIAGRHLSERRAAVAREELQRSAGHEPERVRRLAGAEGVGPAPDALLLPRLGDEEERRARDLRLDRKSTRLNSSHPIIPYA